LPKLTNKRLTKTLVVYKTSKRKYIIQQINKKLNSLEYPLGLQI